MWVASTTTYLSHGTGLTQHLASGWELCLLCTAQWGLGPWVSPSMGIPGFCCIMVEAYLMLTHQSLHTGNTSHYLSKSCQWDFLFFFSRRGIQKNLFFCFYVLRNILHVARICLKKKWSEAKFFWKVCHYIRNTSCSKLVDCRIRSGTPWICVFPACSYFWELYVGMFL